MDDIERVVALDFFRIIKDFRGEIMNKFHCFLQQEDGAAAIEYGLLAGLIAVAIITTVTVLGGNLNTVFGYVSTALGNVVAPAN